MPNISEINGYLLNADTASYAATASVVLGSITSASYALSASYAVSSSYSVNTLTASLALRASGSLTGSLLGTSSWATNAITASYVTGSIFTSANPAATATRAGSASFAETASFAPNYVLNSATSSFVLNSQTGSFATTGSNTFIGNQTITGSLTASSGSVGGSNNMILAQRSNGTRTFEVGQIAGNSVVNIFDSVGNTINRIISNGSTYFASGSLNSVTVGSTGGSGKFNVRGDDASTTPNSTFINGNSVALMTILNNGNIGIGNSPAFNLDVSGSAIFRSQIIGPLTVSGTLIITGSISASAYNFISSSLTQSRVLLDNTFDNTAISAASPNSIRDRSPLLRVYGTYTTASSLTNYTNQIISAYLYPTFNPTNNTLAVFNTLVLEPQFGNANATGSARGLYVTPAFAGTHPNWRSIEWDNTEGYGLYGSGTARNYLNGSLGIGTLTPSASFHTTGSGIIVGSLTVGSSSLGSTENTLVVGLPLAGGVGEGGQILLQASGGLYTSASMLDNYQNKFRVLRGTNAGSDAFKFQVDMQTGQVQIPNYNSITALTGSVIAGLGVDNNGNILTTQPSITTFVGNCNSFTIPNGSLIYGAYLGGTPVTPPNIDTRTGSFATSFFPGYPMPAGTASNLTLVLRTTQSSNNTSFAYIANANSTITGSVITLAAGSAAGIYSSSANPVSFAQGDRLTVILSNPFVAGSSGSGNITTFRFTFQNT